MLLIQHILVSMATDSIRNDFTQGTNGAIQLSEEELKYLENLYIEVIMKQREEDDSTFIQQSQKVAEHYVAIVDGKQREVVGTTYNKLKEIIAKINQCGYFDQVHECSEAIPVEEVCIVLSIYICVCIYNLIAIFICTGCRSCSGHDAYRSTDRTGTGQRRIQ